MKKGQAAPEEQASLAAAAEELPPRYRRLKATQHCLKATQH
jgi:hypothetical protein